MATELDQILWVVILVPLGALTHEVGHWVFGKLFGGDPYFAQWMFHVFPTQTMFRSPEEMTNLEVRIMGGVVFAFLPLAAVALWHQAELLAYFSLGGAGVISTSDMIAARAPKAWKKFAAEESVEWNDIEEHPALTDPINPFT